MEDNHPMVTELIEALEENNDRQVEEMNEGTILRRIIVSAASQLAGDVKTQIRPEYLEHLIDLAFYACLPAHRETFITEADATLASMPNDYRMFLLRLMSVGTRYKAGIHGTSDLATDEDWQTFIESL